MAIRLGGGGLQTYSPEVERGSYIKRTFKPATGGTSSGRSQAQAEAQRQAEIAEAARQAEVQRQAEEKQRLEQAKIEKAQAEAQEKFQSRLAQQRGEQEQARVDKLRGEISLADPQTVVRETREVETGDILKITDVTSGGRRIRTLERPTPEGTLTKVSTFEPGTGGGGVRQTGGLTIQKSDREKQIDIEIGEIRDSRKDRVEDLLAEQKALGFLTTKAGAATIINARDNVRLKDLERERRALKGATGEVTLAGDKTFGQKVVGLPSTVFEFTQTPLDVRAVGKGAVGLIVNDIKSYESNVVIPLRQAIPSLGDTPLGIVAEDIRTGFKKIEDSPTGTTVRFGLPGQVRDTSVESLRTPFLGVIGGKPGIALNILAGESTTALKDISKTYEEKVVIPLSKTKFSDIARENVVKPTVGAFEFYREEVVGGLRTALPSLGDTPIGQIAEAKRIIESKQPGETVQIGLPGQVRSIDVGTYQDKGLIGFGQEIFLGEVETAFTDIARKADFDKGGVITAEQFGAGVRFGTAAGFIAIPGFFESLTAAKLTEAGLGGTFGGAKSAKEFVIQNPLEVGFAAAAGVATIGRGIKARKLAKLRDLTKTPLGKTLSLEQDITKEVVSPKIFKPRVEVSSFTEKDIKGILKDVKLFEIKPKVKGTIFSTEFISESTQSGIVAEVRAIGKAKPKLFLGTAKVSSAGKLTETIQLGKITKVTTVDKGGKGTVELFRKGKSIFSQELKKGDLPALTFGKVKLDKFQVDKQLGGQGLKVQELKLTSGRVTKEFSKITDDVGDLVISDSRLPLSSKRITSELKTRTLVGTDVNKGVRQITQGQQGFLDVITVGERKAQVSVSKVGGGVKFRSRTGQIIEFGEDKTIDQLLFSEFGGKKISAKVINPNIQREITQVSGTRSITTFISPESKGLQVTQKKAAETTKGLLKEFERESFRGTLGKSIDDITKFTTEVGASRREAVKGTFEKLGQVASKKSDIIDVTKSQLLKESKSTFGKSLGPSFEEGVTFVAPTQQVIGPTIVTSTFTQAPFVIGAGVQGVGAGLADLAVFSQGRFLLNLPSQQINSVEIYQKSKPKLDTRIRPNIKIRSDVKNIIKVQTKTNQDQKREAKNVQEVLQAIRQQPVSTSTTGFRLPPISAPPKIPPEIIIPRPFKLKSTRSIIKTPKSLSVQVRRGGVFRTIGTTKSLKKAFELGTQRVGSTLAATFKVSGPKVSFKTPAGFRRSISKSGETLFIEKRSKRLSRTGETREIQVAKKKKKRRSKKR